MKKNTSSLIVGVVGIMCVACCAIAWIGLMLSPPWAADCEPNCCE